jgi:outer membrane protein assembly factor BamB
VSQFGKLFQIQVDGQVYAQPLVLSGVEIGGGTHNVVYVATEHDSVYALDADNGTIYAHVSLIPPGGTTVNANSDLVPACGDITPEVGITGTRSSTLQAIPCTSSRNRRSTAASFNTCTP